MVDLIATLFRFRQFVFEYGPFFLAAWFAVALATGLIAVVRDRGVSFETSKRQLLLSMLWCPAGEMPAQPFYSRIFMFSLAVSVPALAVTSLIGTQVVLLRLILTALFAMALNQFFASIVLGRKKNPERQLPETGSVSPALLLATDDHPASKDRSVTIIQIIWRSFTGQVERAVIPLLTGFGLASALTIYMPAYTIQPWLGEGAWSGPYLAALLVTPFQLVRGAEVILASALLVKGASLGTAMSVMLAAPVATFSMLRHARSTMKARTIILYLLAAWVTAGNLGAAVDGVGRLLDVW